MPAHFREPYDMRPHDDGAECWCKGRQGRSPLLPAGDQYPTPDWLFWLITVVCVFAACAALLFATQAALTY